ncbi:unnamed protein product, partial [Choristocarpus tenellus]
MGYPRGDPWLYLSGDNPELLDVYPELAYMRDIVYLLKAMMAPTSDALPEVRAWTPADARLHWKWVGAEEGYTVKGFGGRVLECQAFVGVDGEERGKKGALGLFRKFLRVVGMSKTRAPLSGANPSNLVDKRIETEDDVLHVHTLPDFGDLLRARDCELLLQYLTVPYMRIPLVLEFFSDPVRMQVLWSEELQEVLDATLFEPAQWQVAEEKVMPTSIPATGREHLTTPCGLLFNELLKSPKVLLASVNKMLDTALELDTGRYTKGQSPLILFILRLVVRVEGFLLFLADETKGIRTRGLGKKDRDVAILEELGQAQGGWRTRLNKEAFPMIERWLKRANKDGDTAVACVLHAHLLMLFKNMRVGDVTQTVASVVLSAQVWLMVHQRFDLEVGEGVTLKRGKGRDGGLDSQSTALQIPPTEIFEILAHHRNKLIDWLEAHPREADRSFEAVVRVITLTGDRKGPYGDDVMFKDRHWESMKRQNCRGRFVPDTEVIRHQIAEQEAVTGNPKESYEDWLRKLTQAVDTEV